MAITIDHDCPPLEEVLLYESISSVVLTGSHYASRYVGCFADDSTLPVRDLPITTAALQASDRQTAVDECAIQCASYRYMGLQWNSECFW
jgi:hypothetical protein